MNASIKDPIIHWPGIDTVLLDMDGTLLDLHYDNHFWLEYLPRLYAEEHGITVAAAHEKLHGAYAREQGTLAWYCLDHWSDRLAMDIPTLKKAVADKIRLRPHVTAFLGALRDSGHEVILVTNAHRTTLDIKMAEVDITDWFHHIVVSHDLAAAKEEQAFWQRLGKTHPFDPSRTLLIDDNEAVLAAAEQYGIGHLLTMLQPDSQREVRTTTRYPGIIHFDEIMPGRSQP